MSASKRNAQIFPLALIFIALLLFPAQCLSFDVVVSLSPDDGSGSVGAGSTMSIPAGMSMPRIASFNTNSVTPSYYFDRPMTVSSAGFTEGGSANYVNPVAIAYTSVPGSDQSHSVPVFFHNGLDGIAIRHDSPYMQYVEQSYIQGFGLDNMVKLDTTMPVYDARNNLVDNREVWQTATGIELSYSAVQNQLALSQQLQACVQGAQGQNVYSSRSEMRNADDPTSNAGATYNAYSLGNGYTVMALNHPTEFFHWNYDFGAYMAPGDILYGQGNQYFEGVGATEATRHNAYLPYQGNYILSINNAGDITLHQGVPAPVIINNPGPTPGSSYGSGPGASDSGGQYVNPGDGVPGVISTPGTTQLPNTDSVPILENFQEVVGNSDAEKSSSLKIFDTTNPDGLSVGNKDTIETTHSLEEVRQLIPGMIDAASRISLKGILMSAARSIIKNALSGGSGVENNENLPYSSPAVQSPPSEVLPVDYNAVSFELLSLTVNPPILPEAYAQPSIEIPALDMIHRNCIVNRWEFTFPYQRSILQPSVVPSIMNSNSIINRWDKATSP
jgi:hypothetical protein